MALGIVCVSITTDLVRDFQAPEVQPVPRPADSAPPPREPQTWSELQIILSRNLFHEPALAATEPPPPEPTEGVEGTELPIGLMGTISSSDPAMTVAAVWDARRRELEVLREGEELPGGAAVVARIERGRLLLSEDGDMRELVLDPHAEYRPETRRARRRASLRDRRLRRARR